MTATGNMEDAIKRSRTEDEERKDNSTRGLEREAERYGQDPERKRDSGSLPTIARQ